MTVTDIQLTDIERRVLTAFADGWEIPDIAAEFDMRRDRVQGIVSRKAALSRDRARQVLDATREAESPLTAPIVMPEKTEPELADPPIPPVEHVAPAREPEPARPPDRLVFRARQAEPEPAAERSPLDEGIDAIALRLRALVTSLVDAAVEQRLAPIRGHLEQLQAALDGGHGR